MGRQMFHPAKCSVLCVSRSIKKLQIKNYPHHQALQEVDHTKYLSVILTLDAIWEANINTVTNNANRTLGLPRQTLKIGAKSVKKQACKSLVRPLLEYACPIWDPHIKHIKIQEAIQRRAAH